MSDDVAVRKVDQENIVAFSILADEVKALKIEQKDLEEQKGALNDLEDEIILTEHLRGGEGMLYRYGDAYIEMEDSKFEEIISMEKENSEKELARVKARLIEVEKKMVTLKADLYARFKDQIGLDFD